MRPTADTDAFEDHVRREPPFIFLAGPIKHWWTCWGSPDHRNYMMHRDSVRHKLIEAGYLTYAPWSAFKGTWNEHAQAVNDAAIAAADLMVILTPVGVPANGTATETGYAKRVGTPTVWLPLGQPVLQTVRALVGPGVSYEEAGL